MAKSKKVLNLQEEIIKISNIPSIDLKAISSNIIRGEVSYLWMLSPEKLYMFQSLKQKLTITIQVTVVTPKDYDQLQKEILSMNGKTSLFILSQIKKTHPYDIQMCTITQALELLLTLAKEASGRVRA